MASDKLYYGITARHYDPAYAADDGLRDVPFYVDIARSVSGRVLEVACGTGRVLLPTARAGVRIDGLDRSPELLAILRAKLAGEPAAVRERVRILEGDMRGFDAGGSYDLVTVPFRPLQHLYSVEDQLRAFRCFNHHLEIGGKLAFNVFYPNFGVLNRPAEEKVELEWVDPDDSGVRVVRSFIREHVDKLHQVFEGRYTFRSYRDDTLIKEESSGLKMSYYTYPHILLLLKGSGFKVLEEFGSFAREPISVCKEMIFIAEKEREVGG